MNDRDMVRALKAIADTNRFRIVQEIAAAGELSCGQIVERFRVSQPTISHHLKILNEAGVVRTRFEGKHHLTSINQQLLGALAELIPSRLGAHGKREQRRKGRLRSVAARA